MSGQTRPPLERMDRILGLLRNGSGVTCRSIGREMEVSPKTIQRDLDFMRDRLQIPLNYDEQKGSWRISSNQPATLFANYLVQNEQI